MSLVVVEFLAGAPDAEEVLQGPAFELALGATWFGDVPRVRAWLQRLPRDVARRVLRVRLERVPAQHVALELTLRYLDLVDDPDLIRRVVSYAADPSCTAPPEAVAALLAGYGDAADEAVRAAKKRLACFELQRR